MGRVNNLVLLCQIFQHLDEVFLAGEMKMYAGLIDEEDKLVVFYAKCLGYKVDIKRKIPSETQTPGFGRIEYRGAVRKINIENPAIDIQFDFQGRLLRPHPANLFGNDPARLFRSSSAARAVFKDQLIVFNPANPQKIPLRFESEAVGLE